MSRNTFRKLNSHDNNDYQNQERVITFQTKFMAKPTTRQKENLVTVENLAEISIISLETRLKIHDFFLPSMFLNFWTLAVSSAFMTSPSLSLVARVRGRQTSSKSNQPTQPQQLRHKDARHSDQAMHPSGHRGHPEREQRHII